MNSIIEGEVIAAPSSSEMTAWKSRIAALETSDPERAEVEITDALTFSNEMLRAVSDVTAQSPAVGAQFASAGVGTAKLAAVRAAEFAKRLDLSKDLRLESDMQVRRWERALGTAIREGQERGEIKAKGGDYASCDVQDIAAKPSPSDFASKTELSNPRGTGIYALTDNATDEQFEAALSEAKDDSNVSRANVVRKLKSATERLADDGVIDMATGEVIDADTLTPENRAARQAERDRMLGLFTDASMFSDALNRLSSLSDSRRADHYLEVARTAQDRPDFNMKHHNPESIRKIAQHLIDYANALEEQS